MWLPHMCGDEASGCLAKHHGPNSAIQRSKLLCGLVMFTMFGHIGSFIHRFTESSQRWRWFVAGTVGGLVVQRCTKWVADSLCLPPKLGVHVPSARFDSNGFNTMSHCSSWWSGRRASQWAGLSRPDVSVQHLDQKRR